MLIALAFSANVSIAGRYSDLYSLLDDMLNGTLQRCGNCRATEQDAKIEAYCQ